MAAYTYKAFGFVFLALAVAGTVLPLLPTTPFLLVSAACFAKSSEKWHRWLLSNATFGPLIRDWHEHRCISRKSKIFAVVSILVFGGASVFLLIDAVALQVVGAVLLSVGLVYVLRLDLCDR